MGRKYKVEVAQKETEISMNMYTISRNNDVGLEKIMMIK